MTKIWTNSGDSHFLEPADLWESRLPKRLADLTPEGGEGPRRRVRDRAGRRPDLPPQAAHVGRGEVPEETRKAAGHQGRPAATP